MIFSRISPIVSISALTLRILLGNGMWPQVMRQNRKKSKNRSKRKLTSRLTLTWRSHKELKKTKSKGRRGLLYTVHLLAFPEIRATWHALASHIQQRKTGRLEWGRFGWALDYNVRHKAGHSQGGREKPSFNHHVQQFKKDRINSPSQSCHRHNFS